MPLSSINLNYSHIKRLKKNFTQLKIPKLSYLDVDTIYEIAFNAKGVPMESKEMNNKINEKLLIPVDTSGLNPQQIRLIKTVNSLLSNVLTTDNEEDFFETSLELMQAVASAVKQANFNHKHSKNEQIHYANQALEFSLDALSDKIFSDDIVSFDN